MKTIKDKDVKAFFKWLRIAIRAEYYLMKYNGAGHVSFIDNQISNQKSEIDIGSLYCRWERGFKNYKY